MNSPFGTTLSSIVARAMRPVLPGLLLGVLTLLFSLGLGVTFGLNEDAIKSRLTASAEAVRVTLYAQDDAKIKGVLDKSWVYMQRAHLHGGALGTTAVALSLVVVLLGTGAMIARLTSLALGAGALGYSVFWLWAGFRAPGLGSTGAAKESLKLLAMPASGLFVIGTAMVAFLVIRAMMRPVNADDMTA